MPAMATVKSLGWDLAPAQPDPLHTVRAPQAKSPLCGLFTSRMTLDRSLSLGLSFPYCKVGNITLQGDC